MKAAEKKRIARAIEEQMPGLRTIGSMVVAMPIGQILRGICIENCSDTQRVYLLTFVQPLFVPFPAIFLSFGYRIGGGCHTWSVADVEQSAAFIVRDAAPFFSPMLSAAAFAHWSLLDGRYDEAAREARAYALVASGQYAQGIRALRSLAGSLRTTNEPDWVLDMKLRAEELAALAEKDGEAAQQRLRQWERETRSALRLSDIP